MSEKMTKRVNTKEIFKAYGVKVADDENIVGYHQRKGDEKGYMHTVEYPESNR